MSTTDEPLRALDTRAAGAATDLHDRAAARTVPTFDPDLVAARPLPEARPAGRGRALAVAAIVVALAALAGVLITQLGHGDDGTDPAKVVTTEPRPYVVADLPEGFALAGAGEITGTVRDQRGDGDGSRSGPLTVYGPSPEQPALGLAVLPRWEDDATETDGVEPVQVGDRTAYRYDGYGLGRRALIVPQGDQAIVIVSPTLEASEVEAIAAEAEIAEDGTVDLGGFDLPSGWHEVGRAPDVLGSASPLLASADPNEVGKYVLYERNAGQRVEGSRASEATPSVEDGSATTVPDGDPESGPASEQGAPEALLPDFGMLTVSSTQGQQFDVQIAALFADSATKAEVRGHDALVTSSGLIDGDGGSTPMRSVTWLERPGEVLRVSGTGLEEADLVAAANSLELVTSAEWKDLVERSQLGEFDPANAGDPKKVKVADGRFADGTRWLLAAVPSGDPDYPTPSVDLSVFSTDNSSSSSSGTASGDGSEPLAAITATDLVSTRGQRFLGALVTPEVVRVELRNADGGVVGEPDLVEGGGYRGFAAVAPADAAIAVALAADGSERGRFVLADPDSFEGVEIEPGTVDTTEPDPNRGTSSSRGPSSGGSSGGGTGN